MALHKTLKENLYKNVNDNVFIHIFMQISWICNFAIFVRIFMKF